MPEWPATRVTLLDRLHDPQDQEAWAEFVSLYGPLVFSFARRRLPQDEDAADVMQEVLSAVLRGTYQRPSGRFQKWLVTVLLNKIRDFHAARVRRGEVSGGTSGGRALAGGTVPRRRGRMGPATGSGICFAPRPSACAHAPIPSTGTPSCAPPCRTSPARRWPRRSTCR